MSKNVGVIGLGAMGYGVASSLLRAGFNVHACDVRKEVLDKFAAAGGVACANPAELAAKVDVVITLVSMPPRPRRCSSVTTVRCLR